MNGGGYYSIRRGQYPANDRYKHHQVIYHTVAQGHASVLFDERNALPYVHAMPFTTVVHHRKAGYYSIRRGQYPANDRYKHHQVIYHTVAQGHASVLFDERNALPYVHA